MRVRIRVRVRVRVRARVGIRISVRIIRVRVTINLNDFSLFMGTIILMPIILMGAYHCMRIDSFVQLYTH